MDHVLFDLLAEGAPKFNPRIVEGLATHHVPLAESYLDRVLRLLEPELPPELKYHGIRRCTPEEEYRYLISRLKSSGSIATIEHAPTDTYLVKIEMSFQGVMFDTPIYLQLPFVRPGGLMRVHGSLYAISPVMIDQVISVTDNDIFIHIGRAKLIFKIQNHTMVVDGREETMYVHWSTVYNVNDKTRMESKKSRVNGKTTLSHYLFGKYGLKGTFRRYCNTEIEVGTVDSFNANPEKWADYTIVSSVTQNGGFKPRAVKEKYYTGSRIAIAIPRKDYNLTTAAMLCGFFYVVDHFPDRILPEYVDGSDPDSEIRMWRILLGLFLLGSPDGEGNTLEKMNEHYRTIDDYLNFDVRTELSEIGVYCDHIYDLFYYMIENLSALLVSQSNRLSSLYDKRLVILKYLMADIVTAINLVMFKFSSSAMARRQLTMSDVKKTFSQQLKPDMFLKKMSGHGEINAISTPSDSMYFDITSKVVQQVDSSKKTKRRLIENDRSKFLHVSLAEVGSYNTVGKADPTGRSKLNPHVQIGDDGSIKRDPSLVTVLDEIQRDFSN